MIRHLIYVSIAILTIPTLYAIYAGYTVSHNQDRKIQYLNESIFQNKDQWKDITIDRYTPTGFTKEIQVGNHIIRTAYAVTTTCLTLIIALLITSNIQLNRKLNNSEEGTSVP